MASISYKLEKIQDGIYHCIIDDMYDLAMTFCRIQEFYESPFSQIRGKNFKLLDFMRIYSKNNGDNICFILLDDIGKSLFIYKKKNEIETDLKIVLKNIFLRFIN